MANGRNFN